MLTLISFLKSHFTEQVTDLATLQKMKSLFGFKSELYRIPSTDKYFLLVDESDDISTPYHNITVFQGEGGEGYAPTFVRDDYVCEICSLDTEDIRGFNILEFLLSHFTQSVPLDQYTGSLPKAIWGVELELRCIPNTDQYFLWGKETIVDANTMSITHRIAVFQGNHFATTDVFWFDEIVAVREDF